MHHCTNQCNALAMRCAPLFEKSSRSKGVSTVQHIVLLFSFRQLSNSSSSLIHTYHVSVTITRWVHARNGGGGGEQRWFCLGTSDDDAWTRCQWLPMPLLKYKLPSFNSDRPTLYNNKENLNLYSKCPIVEQVYIRAAAAVAPSVPLFAPQHTHTSSFILSYPFPSLILSFFLSLYILNIESIKREETMPWLALRIHP